MIAEEALEVKPSPLSEDILAESGSLCARAYD